MKTATQTKIKNATKWTLLYTASAAVGYCIGTLLVKMTKSS